MLVPRTSAALIRAPHHAVPAQPMMGSFLEDGSRCLAMVNCMTLPTERGMVDWCPNRACARWSQWLDARSSTFSSVQLRFSWSPGAIPLNIWPDPYLARLFCSSFTSLLCEATEADYLAVFSARDDWRKPQHAWAKPIKV